MVLASLGIKRKKDLTGELLSGIYSSLNLFQT
jgi:hypothetical protein